MSDPKDEMLNAVRSIANERIAEDPPKESREDEYTKDEGGIKMETSRVRDYDGLVRECKIDTELWEVERFKCRAYEVTYVPRATRKLSDQQWIRPNSQAITVPMFSVSASFKKRQNVADARDILA